MAKRGGFPGGMPGNMNNLMKQAQKMQRQMEEAQKQLEEAEVTAAAGGGAPSGFQPCDGRGGRVGVRLRRAAGALLPAAGGGRGACA